eukprot:6503102-Prymnesium_polylepis.1
MRAVRRGIVLGPAWRPRSKAGGNLTGARGPSGVKRVKYYKLLLHNPFPHEAFTTQYGLVTT